MATGGAPSDEVMSDQDLPNWGHESIDDRLNNMDWSGLKKANRSAEKNKKKFGMECESRLTNDISPESSPVVGRRRARTPHTFPHTRYVSQMSVPEQAELERLKQKINFSDLDQRSIGSDSQGRATAANNKRQLAENRKPFNFLPLQINTNKDKESTCSPPKKETTSLPKDFLSTDFTKEFLQNYPSFFEEDGRESSIDSSQAADPQQQAKEELKNMKKQHALLTRMLQQQEQLRALKGRQAALLALQQKAEQAIARMDESVVTETTGSVSGLSFTSELNEELNDLIQRFHNQLHDSQTQTVPNNRRQAESLSLAREVSQSRNSSLSEAVSEEKDTLLSKVGVLLEKKQKMDSFLELHTLHDHTLNNTANSPQRSISSAASVPLSLENRAAGSSVAAVAYPSNSVTPLNETDDEDNQNPVEKIKKLKEVRKRLNELRDLVHYYEQTSDMMTDAVNENTKDEEETEDSEYESEQEATQPATNIRNPQHISSWAQMNSITNAHCGTNNRDERPLNTECEVNNRSSVNLRSFNVSSALDCLYNREDKEEDCDLAQDEDNAEEDHTSRGSLSSRSSVADDVQNADFEQKYNRLIAAKEKLRQLQDLVAMYGDDTESETVAADRSGLGDHLLAEVANHQPNNTRLNAPKSQKDIVLKEQARERFYESKLQQQQKELKHLQEERKKLIEIQEEIKTLQKACPDLQLSTSSVGGLVINGQMTATTSTPGVSLTNKAEAPALPDPEDSSSIDNEVWSEIRRHKILREDLRQRRKQLENLMAEHQRRQGLAETVSGASLRSDDSVTHGLNQHSRTEKTMATWGGSTQCAIDDGDDEEEEEEDCLSAVNQEEEEEEQDVTFTGNVSYPHSHQNRSMLGSQRNKNGWKNPHPFSVDGNYRPSPKTRQQQNISMRRQENSRWVSDLSHVEEKVHWQEQINQLKKQIEFSTNICQTLMQDQQTLSYILQSMLTSSYGVMPSNLGAPQVQLLMHQLNQSYTQLTWQQNNVQRLKQMLNDVMLQQQEHFPKDSQQRTERGNNAPPPPTTPNVFAPFSFLPPPMNYFNMHAFPNIPNILPGMNFNSVYQSGFRDFTNNVTSQPDTPLQPQDQNTSGKTEYMSFPKPFESNSSNATENQGNVPKPADGNENRDICIENQNKDHVKKHIPFDSGHAASSNSLKQSDGTRRVKQFDEESLESLSSMPDPVDPTTVTKTFKSRKASAQASLASKDKTPKTKNKKRKISHQKPKAMKNTGFRAASVSSAGEPKESKSKHAQTEEILTGNTHTASCDHLERMRKDNPTVDISSEAGSEFAMFEALRDTIYSEVATLISQNEARPHFLIELFHELQLLNTDYLRQKALFSLQDIVTRRITENSQKREKSTKVGELAGWMASNSEFTPSESLATTDDEMFAKNLEDPVCPEGEQNDGDNVSTMSTSSNFEPFATDDLGNTVIHLDQALARMREYERMKTEAENSLGAESCNNPNNAATNVEESQNDSESRQAQLSGGDGPGVPCPRIDTQQLDRQIKAIMKEVIPFLKEHMEEVCSPHLLTSIRKMVLTLTQQNDESKEFVKFFHKQLGSILQDSLAKFSSKKLKDCGEDLLVEISEVLFNELAFFRLMQDLDNNSTGIQGRCLKKSEAAGALQSFTKEAQKIFKDGVYSATREVDDEDKDKDETETIKNAQENKNSAPCEDQSGRSDASDEDDGDESLPVSISLSKAETQALTNYGSGEDENEEEENYEFEAGLADVQTSLEANSETADETEQIQRDDLETAVTSETSEACTSTEKGEELTLPEEQVNTESVPPTLPLTENSDKASSATVAADDKSPIASPRSSEFGSPATESPVLVNEFETGSGNLSQKSDEDDFVKVEDLSLTMSKADLIKEIAKEEGKNNLSDEILNLHGEENSAVELAGDPLLLKEPDMFGAHSA